MAGINSGPSKKFRPKLFGLLPTAAQLGDRERQDEKPQAAEQEIYAEDILSRIKCRNIVVVECKRSEAKTEDGIDDRTVIKGIKQALERTILALNPVGALAD